MFGTLIFQLPCQHQNGDLIIQHYYADCMHEISKINVINRISQLSPLVIITCIRINAHITVFN
ncbi:hypothetical protein AKO1_006596 [Acrasis kona]|uniref:Uncharacterized protein n=1 Tax=Acrasis kona TaxID=1008807 RepID=A0AAW2ZNI9_9EUKA